MKTIKLLEQNIEIAHYDVHVAKESVQKRHKQENLKNR